MDQLRKNWTKLEKMDQIGKNFKNGSNWEKMIKMDQIGGNCIKFEFFNADFWRENSNCTGSFTCNVAK